MNDADPLAEYEALEKLAKRGIVPKEPATILALLAEIRRLRDAIHRALSDSETGEGWGPDVTVAGYLREALEGKHGD